MSTTIQWINNLAACHIWSLDCTQAQQKKNLVILPQHWQPVPLWHLAEVTTSSAALTACVWCRGLCSNPLLQRAMSGVQSHAQQAAMPALLVIISTSETLPAHAELDICRTSHVCSVAQYSVSWSSASSFVVCATYSCFSQGHL